MALFVIVCCGLGLVVLGIMFPAFAGWAPAVFGVGLLVIAVALWRKRPR